MANIPLKTLTFSGLDNVYTVVDPEEVDKKANQDGSYDDLGAGSTKQLISDNYIEDKIPYLYRRSGGNGADRAFDTIVGGSVVWNQLCPPMSTFDGQNATFSVNGDVTTITASSTATGAGYIGISRSRNIDAPIGTHKYLFTVQIKTDKSGAYTNMQYGNNISVSKDLTAGTWSSVEGIKMYTTPSGTYYQLRIIATFAEGDIVTVKGFMIFDLTAMFGSTIADYIYSLETASWGSGIAKLKSWGFFTKDYYAYNAGELMSVSNLQSHDTVGFNLWDEEIERATVNWTTFILTPNEAGRWASKNYIPVIPNATYYITQRTNNFVAGYTDSFGNGGRGLPLDSLTNLFTIPDDVHFIKFGIDQIAEPTNICINLYDPSRNGEYEPYTKRSYSLDSTLTLRGIPKLDADNNLYYDGDEYASDGTVTRRYGVVDLGTLSWEKVESASLGTYFYTDTRLMPSGNVKFDGSWGEILYPIINSKYTVTTRTTSTFVDKCITVDGAIANQIVTQVQIKDSAYTDAASFRAAMSGVMFVYKLATPTTETADPYTNPQVVSPDGTEEYVTTSIVPVGHITKYPENIRAKIDGLPWNLSMIAPIDNGTTATRAYSTGQYFMHNNQFCKAKTSIASGATFTLDTNYEVTTVATELYNALNS